MNKRFISNVVALVLSAIFGLGVQGVVAQALAGDDGHGHTADELPELMFTKIFNQKYEAYLGIVAPVAGQQIHFHLNLTDITSYKPVEHAHLTVKIGNASTKDAHGHNGEFHLNITPEGVGLQPVFAHFEIEGKSYEVKIADIEVFESISAAAHDAVVAENPEEIKLPKKWMWENDFGVEFVQKLPFDEKEYRKAA